MKKVMSGLQRVGGALMLPIAVLPVAGLLLRLGQPDLLNISMLAAAGDAIFSSLGLLFAIGVAVGLARENHGAAGLAAVVGFLVTMKGAEVLIDVPAGEAAAELAKLSVPAGILAGLIGGLAYNRFSDVRLPSYLAFFGGRRFVPIVCGVVGVGMAAVFGFGWPVLEQALDLASRSILGAGEFGLFVYGVLNRVLIVTGLHHIINNVAWFLVGDYNGVTGDLKRFFAGDPQAGAFMSGFFPVFMFGLPAACLAMYHEAEPPRRAVVGSLLGSMALTSFLTGVTEPVEFSFMFLAPMLYAVHALLTGTAHVIMHWLDVRLGFSFSAGFFDYVLNFGKASHPLLLLPVGALYFGLYYVTFRYCIRRFNLRTPGREPVEASGNDVPAGKPQGEASAFIQALGGASNLVSVGACTTRLRLEVRDQTAVDVEALKRLGAMGVVRPSQNSLQVILGPVADQIAGEIRAGLQQPQAGDSAESLLAALGGAANVREVEALAGRLRATVNNTAAVNDSAVCALGLRGVARPGANCVHILAGPDTTRLYESLRAVLLSKVQQPARS